MNWEVWTMKCAVSLYNKAVFRKNITRFAPVWALYGALLLMMFMLMLEGSAGEAFAQNLTDSLGIMAVINFFYAFIVVQLLLGDLYSSRMCNALHALPMRRETWLATHALSGLLFSLVPNAVLALLSSLISGSLWAVPFLWLGAVTLEYVFFFGVALLAALLVGNRFAMALVYIILNGFSLIAYWLIHSIYSDLLYGIELDQGFFFLLTPVVQMAMLASELIPVEIRWANGYITDARWSLGPGWIYLGICGVLGLAAGALALVCYRRRQLEVAGDFMAQKKLSVVFLILYTLCGGACCQGFFDLLMGQNSVLYLVLGLAIGFFTGCMLLERTVRVFRKGRWLGFGAVLLSIAVSILLVRVDPVGITRWVPEAGQVTQVHLYTGSSYGGSAGITLEDPQDVEKVLKIHRLGVEQRQMDMNGKPDTVVWLEYTLENGLQIRRHYCVDIDTREGQLLRQFLGRPEAVLGPLYTGQPPMKLTRGEISGTVDENGEYVVFTGAKELEGLIQAVLADCLAGDLVTDSRFDHEDAQYFWVQFECLEESGIHYYWDVRGNENCRNLMRWMAEQGLTLEKY